MTGDSPILNNPVDRFRQRAPQQFLCAEQIEAALPQRRWTPSSGKNSGALRASGGSKANCVFPIRGWRYFVPCCKTQGNQETRHQENPKEPQETQEESPQRDPRLTTWGGGYQSRVDMRSLALFNPSNIMPPAGLLNPSEACLGFPSFFRGRPAPTCLDVQLLFLIGSYQ